MKNYVVMTDSCCDLPFNYIKEKNIPFVSLTCSYNGNEYIDDFGKTLDPSKFFEDMKAGAVPKTSQPSAEEFIKKFRSILEDGKDVLYISISSHLSGTLNSARIAKDMIIKEFPNRRIYIFDSLSASLGQGLFVIKALEMQEAGASFEFVVDYLEMNVQKLNIYITVDDLSHLRRGGRISATAATLGKVLNVKPVLSINNEGRVIPVIKIRGRKKTLKTLVDFVEQRIERADEQTIAICHGDCIEEATKLRDLILENSNVKKILINTIGPVIGTHGGPGTLAIFFIGKERQQGILEK
ncbi:DegV family protein [Clostridium grantii]|uniref:EDD domain protein, DegV family n=1 Tax=Clostridium grantii DSM 8605 TaxID=1121316 RepID=A0A1M5UNV4_9CLOT|nr:DegV family protein [Clostridium grantii]SHH64621.1 EDD domain protein, DegV family [Clostridium grantii DSM 8605]